jgi:hypothetical protein
MKVALGLTEMKNMEDHPPIQTTELCTKSSLGEVECRMMLATDMWQEDHPPIHTAELCAAYPNPF